MMKKIILAVFAVAISSGLAFGQTINNLGAGGAVAGTDMVPAYQGANPATRVTAAQFNTYIASAVKTLTNTTFDTAGTGNALSINGVAATANTGTGALARATSPVFVTPTIGAATATSINGNAITAGTGTLTLGTSNVLTATSTTSVGRGQYLGTGTSDNATAGNIGEYVSATVASGSAVSLTSGSPAAVASISLTAGDWDVFGSLSFQGGSTTTLSYILAGISQSAGGTGNLPSVRFYGSATPFSVLSFYTQETTLSRVSISSTTTVYLVAQAGFAASTLSGFGTILARRVR